CKVGAVQSHGIFPRSFLVPTPMPLATILTLTGNDFGIAFYDYLSAKTGNDERLNSVEHEAWLLMTMLLDIEMEGFEDLFYQFYSLEECRIVETTLKKLELHKLACLFAEAKTLYIGGRTDITEDEYRAIDPWTNTLGKNDGWSRFEAIGEEILAEG